jgi:protein phosphatase PTC7
MCQNHPSLLDSTLFHYVEGVSFGVADGVGGWVDSGVDPALFSQALMYHAHSYSRNAWAGEPEIDPTLDYEEREQVEGWEVTPYECLDLAYGGVLREKIVQAGKSFFLCRQVPSYLVQILKGQVRLA